VALQPDDWLLTCWPFAAQYAGIADNDLLYFSYTNQVHRHHTTPTRVACQCLLCQALIETLG
jgi:hypothetical protein